MDWVTLKYPRVWYIVEVKYSGDIGIITCRTKEYEEPTIKDNSYGFTKNFLDYDKACEYAKAVANELGIKTCIKS